MYQAATIIKPAQLAPAFESFSSVLCEAYIGGLVQGRVCVATSGKQLSLQLWPLPQIDPTVCDLQVDRSFPLAEAAKAHEYMEAKKNKGKVTLTV